MTVVHGAHHWGEWPDEYFALAYSCDRCGWPSLGLFNLNNHYAGANSHQPPPLALGADDHADDLAHAS